MSSSRNEQLKDKFAKTGTQISIGLAAFRNRPGIKAAESTLAEKASQLRSGISQISKRDDVQAAKSTISTKAAEIGSTVSSSISTVRANPDVKALGSSVSAGVQSLTARVQQIDLFTSPKQSEEEAEAERRRQMLADEDAARAAVIRESQEACLQHMQADLIGFLEKNPEGTYEQWIEAFHPENAYEGQLLTGIGKTIDHRFYVQESDHRKLWNDNVPDRPVPARTHMFQDGESQVPADLLGAETPSVRRQDETVEFDDPWAPS